MLFLLVSIVCFQLIAKSFAFLHSTTICSVKRRNLALNSRPGKDNNDHLLSMYLQDDLKKSGVHSGDRFANYWNLIRSEASEMARNDIKEAAMLSNTILQHHSLDDAVIDYVSSHLESAYFSGAQMRNIFVDIRDKHPNISSLWAMDLMASSLRDKMLPNSVSTMLFSKGYHALVTHRVANALWYSGRDGLARYLQSTCSRVFNVDIHPACRTGARCYFSSGAGMVIGETCVIGDDCSISHSITFGSNGKESGNRHPKLGNGVYVGPMVTILGNIPIGEGSVINAGSVVTKPVEAFNRMGGVPAKVISVHSPEEIKKLISGNYGMFSDVENVEQPIADHEHHFYI